MANLSELEFLRKQVDELTNLLHDYREKYGPMNESKPVGSAVIPPWHLDQSLLSPLLIEYEATLQATKDEMERFKRQYKQVQKHVDQLTAENERLTRDLEDVLEERLRPLTADGIADADHELNILNNLQSQLRLMTQERDTCNDLVRASKREVDRLELELTDLRRTNITASHWQQLQLQYKQMKDTFAETIEQLNVELKQAQDEAQKYKNEVILVERRVSEYKRTLDITRQDLSIRDKSELLRAESQIRSLITQLEQKSQAALDLQKDVDGFRDLVEDQMAELKKQNAIVSEKDAQLFESTQKVKDTLRTAEDAVLQRNEMELICKQYEDEVGRLRDELNALCDAAGRKTKEEVDKAQIYLNNKNNKLVETIRSLEMENGATKAELERCLREKRAVESELEKVYQEGMQQAYKDGGRYDQLNKRACDAEMQRDEMAIRLHTAQSELQHLELRLDNDRQRAARDTELLTERLHSLQRDFDRVNTDRLRYLEEAESAHQATNVIRLDSEAASRKHQNEVTCLEHAISLRQKEFEVKLAALEDSHRQTLGKLRDEITSQQRAANKWKEEHTFSSDRWEKLIQSLRGEIAEKEARISELNTLLREARDRTVDAETMMKEYNNQMKKIEMRTKEAEKRAAEMNYQNASKDRKIRQLMVNQSRDAKVLSDYGGVRRPRSREATFRLSDIDDSGDHALSRSRSPSVLDDMN